MNQNHVKSIPFLFTSLLYIFGFFIFLEWLYPIGQISDTSHLEFFILYAGFCFFISLFKLSWWQTGLFKGIGMLFCIHLLFFDGSFLNIIWIQDLITDVLYNVDMLFAREWYQLTALFRSALFLLLIWLMSYLIHYWFIVVKRTFVFITLTIVYLAVLDTFTVYDAQFPIIRVFILAFLALGMSHFFKRIEQEDILFSWKKRSVQWLLPIVGMVLFSAMIGYSAPKLDPKWPDPVPLIQSATGTGSGSDSVIRKVGYGEDDSRLGGSFIQDDTPVFQAMDEKEHYWRIETKEIYTGKGWESLSADESAGLNVLTPDNLPLRMFQDDVDTEKSWAFIQMEKKADIPKIVYPYGILSIDIHEAQIIADENTESFYAQYNGQNITPDQYSVIYDHPSFNIDELNQSGEKDPTEIKERYTQLPENLPERVHDLAEEITDTFETRYEKALAIEQYFGQGGEFMYQTEDVPVPREDQDYVDQFLFESQVGYCDNYSTSMVVLLRTLDIPTRWVKGFTAGEMTTPDAVDIDVPSDMDVYEVTSSNAHSWVEVFFPDTGWVPFEPTQGFTNYTDFHVEAETDGDEDVIEAPEADAPDSEEHDELLEPVEEEEVATEISGQGESSFEFKTWHFIVALLLLLTVGVIVYRKRFHLQAYIHSKKMSKHQNAESYQAAYHFLLKVLEHHNAGRKPEQTLREYARHIDGLYSTRSMRLLTHDYEQILYNKHDDNLNSSEFVRIWQEMVKHIIG